MLCLFAACVERDSSDVESRTTICGDRDMSANMEIESIEAKPTTTRINAETNNAKPSGLSFRRLFSAENLHPYERIAWERRTAIISNEKGQTDFEQTGVGVPARWSDRKSVV